MDALDLDANGSAWLDDLPPYEPAPPLAGVVSADVAIVGGGLTGVSTAWHVAQRCPEHGVVLLEARTLGNGASGRSGGQVLNWISGLGDEDAEAVRRVWDLTRSGIDLVERLARDHAPAAAFTRNGCLEVHTEARSAERGQERVERLARLGIPLRWLGARQIGIRGAVGAALDPLAGQVNGVALLRGLRPGLEAAGVTLYEATPVMRVEEGSRVRLVAPGGEVRARAVVLATGAYTPGLGYFRDAILPLHAHAIGTAPLPPEVWAEAGWGLHDAFSDDLERLAYGCRTGTGRLVFGGGSNAAYAYLLGGRAVFPGSPGRAQRAFAAIRRTLDGYFPALARKPIARRWTGTLDITLDRLCAIGVRGEARNVYYALGYSGHGITLAVLAGKILSDLLAGEHDPWRAFPFYQRRPPRLPPEPLRWLGYQLYTRLTGRSPRRG